MHLNTSSYLNFDGKEGLDGVFEHYQQLSWFIERFA